MREAGGLGQGDGWPGLRGAWGCLSTGPSGTRQGLLCVPHLALRFGPSGSQFPSLPKEGWPEADLEIRFPRGLIGALLPGACTCEPGVTAVTSQGSHGTTSVHLHSSQTISPIFRGGK